ncbi:chaperone DnaJ protein [Trypanosoma theileri]|uniref:Chaperone DnaJ protein n=1 Tax=Trypanosoma theileri TaxID=67003 RepID=A0A1X0P710_9TRYP|nr:chaperone DnaJ protein [Trypanosoma theileri]ORC92736.1 chaperone DnaJ protein [Trypanosoma theileri]
MTGDLERSRRLYQTLLLPDFSGIDEVRQAYKSLALKYHPDKNLHDPSAAEKFRQVRVAYEILSCVERKRKYDCTLRLFQPLGSNSFAPGARSVPTATTEGGMFASSPIGNATSCIYEELFNYAAKKAERQQRRPSPSCTPRGDRASQYTKEQKEFFRKREKEHQAELRRRLEQEKREQRAKELEALRREQERREEALQRSQQRRARATVSSRAYSSTGIRRSSPFPRPAPEQPPPQSADKKKFVKSNSAREIHIGSSLPETVRAVPSPRHRRPSLDLDAERAERIRREKERQAEVRRNEQEKYLERLMRQRIREVRLREREAEEEQRRERDNQQQLLALAERSEREQVIAPQEQLERRRLWREWQQELRGQIMAMRRAGLAVAHEEALCHLRNSEATEFAHLELRFREGIGRIGFLDQYRRLLREVALELQKIKQRTLMNDALGDGCAIIRREEHAAWSLLDLLVNEWRSRLALQQNEEDEIFQLIRKRANERQSVHLCEEERARISEREASAATIALLQKEIEELKLTLQPCCSSVVSDKVPDKVPTLPQFRAEFVTVDGITTVPQYPADNTQSNHQESLSLSGNGTCNGSGGGNNGNSGGLRAWIESASRRLPRRGTSPGAAAPLQPRCPTSLSSSSAATVPLTGVGIGEPGASDRTVLLEGKVSTSPPPAQYDSVSGNSTAGHGFSKVKPTPTMPSLDVSFNSGQLRVVATGSEALLEHSSLHRSESH